MQSLIQEVINPELMTNMKLLVVREPATLEKYERAAENRRETNNDTL